MGEFKSGLWIAGLSIYFFLFFLIVTSVISGSAEMGIDPGDISTTGDPGFESDDNQFSGINSECSGSITTYCIHTNADDNDSCSVLTGCSWSGTFCVGTHAYTCEAITNQSYCSLLDCTWTGSRAPTSIDPNEEYDWSTMRDTIGIMTGFRADIGIPSWANWIFSFLFFWIPFLLLVWSIYMALPFLH